MWVFHHNSIVFSYIHSLAFFCFGLYNQDMIIFRKFLNYERYHRYDQFQDQDLFDMFGVNLRNTQDDHLVCIWLRALHALWGMKSLFHLIYVFSVKILVSLLYSGNWYIFLKNCILFINILMIYHQLHTSLIISPKSY